jgi:hypothetical protein
MVRSSIFYVSAAAVLALTLASAPLGYAGGQTSDFQRDIELYPDAALVANESMSALDSRANASAHMYTTVLKPQRTGDDRRAQEILDILRRSMSRYKDYRAAIADGYQAFMPKTPQHLYWFVSDRNAYAAAYEFNPGHPSVLLYRKAKGSYELSGAIFTAPKNATELQLNDRVPLSVAQWYEHVNLCAPPRGAASQQADEKKFGLAGSIANHAACAAAGGRWVPQVFGWMLRVFPFEADPAAIWR